MTTRRPLVIIDSQVQELPAGDTLAGVEGGLPDAPQDGKTYGRKNAEWSEVTGGGGGGGISAGKAIALSMIFGA